MHKPSSSTELSQEEIDYLRDLFYTDIVPKLIRHHARNGVIGCGFAGPRYDHWQIHFRPRGSGFDIVDFEYDEEGGSIDLDL